MKNQKIRKFKQWNIVHFEGKTLREGHQAGLVFARQCPGSPDTCNPDETGQPGLPES
jgi:hypothetical protein